MENKVANLLWGIVVLEERFDTCPNNVAEQRRRDGLILHAIIPPLLLVATYFHLAGSMR